MKLNRWQWAWLILSVLWATTGIGSLYGAYLYSSLSLPSFVLAAVFIVILPIALLYAAGRTLGLIIRGVRRTAGHDHAELRGNSAHLDENRNSESIAYAVGVTRVRRTYWRWKLVIAAAATPFIAVGIYAGVNQSYGLLILYCVGIIAIRVALNLINLRQAANWGIPPRSTLVLRSAGFLLKEAFLFLALPALPFVYWNGMQYAGLAICAIGVFGYYVSLLLVHRAYRCNHIIILRHFGADSLDLISQSIGPVVRYIGLPVTLTEKLLKPKKILGIDTSATEFRKIEDSEWRDVARLEMRRAVAIVFDVGVMTPAIEWELATVAESFSDKVVYVAATNSQLPDGLSDVLMLGGDEAAFQAGLGKRLVSVVTGK